MESSVPDGISGTKIISIYSSMNGTYTNNMNYHFTDLFLHTSSHFQLLAIFK